jgi:hypothetical protein
LSTLVLDTNQNLMDPSAPYYIVLNQIPSNDFNREIVEPNSLPDFPEGALGIRVDEDFYAVAALPLRFQVLPIELIVKAIWPDRFEDAVFGPDTFHPPRK